MRPFFFTLVVLVASTAHAGFRVVHEFSGSWPSNSLTMFHGQIYGTTRYNLNDDSLGTLWRANIDGSGFETIHSFQDANASPRGGMVAVSDRLYGMTYVGRPTGYGGVYGIDPDGGGFNFIHEFDGTDGGAPDGGLAAIGDYLYGISYRGSMPGDNSIFRVRTNGDDFRVLQSMPGLDNGYATLTPVGDRLFGVSATVGGGSIYSLKSDGTDFQTLYTFDASVDGATGNPFKSVVHADGVLYGLAGGSDGIARAYRVNLDGTGYSVLHYFEPSDGSEFLNGLTIAGGKLYGTARFSRTAGVLSAGTLFEMGLDGSGFRVLHRFEGFQHGWLPNSDLLFTNGVLYGVTQSGGPTQLDGTLYAYDLGEFPDTNGDGRIDLEDLNNVRNNFGEAGGLGDTNADGAIDLVDLNNVRSHFGDLAESSVVPEPSGAYLGLMAVALATGLRPRRRRSP